MTRTDVTLAKELKADALRYPDERDEILLEAAETCGRVANKARAKDILTELVGAGGNDGLQAREPCDGSSL